MRMNSLLMRGRYCAFNPERPVARLSRRSEISRSGSRAMTGASAISDILDKSLIPDHSSVTFCQRSMTICHRAQEVPQIA